MDTITKLITPRRMTTLFEEYRIFSIKLGLVDLCLFEFAVYSGLLLLKKSFFNAFFVTAVAPLYTVSLLLIPQINVRGGVSTTSKFASKTGVYSGPALNRENTVSALRIYFIRR